MTTALSASSTSCEQVSRPDRGRPHAEVHAPPVRARSACASRRTRYPSCASARDVDRRRHSRMPTRSTAVGRDMHAKRQPGRGSRACAPRPSRRRRAMGSASAKPRRCASARALVEAHARAAHPREDHVGRAVDHAVERADAVAEQARARAATTIGNPAPTAASKYRPACCGLDCSLGWCLRWGLDWRRGCLSLLHCICH